VVFISRRSRGQIRRGEERKKAVRWNSLSLAKELDEKSGCLRRRCAKIRRIRRIVRPILRARIALENSWKRSRDNPLPDYSPRSFHAGGGGYDCAVFVFHPARFCFLFIFYFRYFYRVSEPPARFHVEIRVPDTDVSANGAFVKPIIAELRDLRWILFSDAAKSGFRSGCLLILENSLAVSVLFSDKQIRSVCAADSFSCFFAEWHSAGGINRWNSEHS